jgi:hypothetical protein
MGLREMPKTANILGKMVKRLRCHLKAMEMEMVLDSDLSFWIACLGVIAATDQEDGDFFAGMVDGMKRKLGLEGAEDGEGVLGRAVRTGRIGV